MARIPFQITPGMGCPGGIVERGPRAGSTLPLCITCSRLGGRDLAPAVTITRGFVECCNFHDLSVAGTAEGVHPAEVGNPDGGGAL